MRLCIYSSTCLVVTKSQSCITSGSFRILVVSELLLFDSARFACSPQLGGSFGRFCQKKTVCAHFVSSHTCSSTRTHAPCPAWLGLRLHRHRTRVWTRSLHTARTKFSDGRLSARRARQPASQREFQFMLARALSIALSFFPHSIRAHESAH